MTFPQPDPTSDPYPTGQPFPQGQPFPGVQPFPAGPQDTPGQSAPPPPATVQYPIGPDQTYQQPGTYQQPDAAPYGQQPYQQYGAPAQPYSYPVSGYGYPYSGYGPASQTNTMAILALVFAFVFSPLGIVFGHIARKQIRERGEGGSGLATAGLILGYVFTALMVAYCVGVVVLVAATTPTSTG